MRSHFPFVLLATVALLATSAFGFPFAKDSGVTELTPATLPGFLKTHKPVYIMFYAPWCGHCKSLHPDYQKFGDAVKDVVRVGAINADQYKEIGGQYGIQGFPTIKYWKMGDKKGQKPLDYQGQRNKAALHSAAIGEIRPQGVHTAKSMLSVKHSLEDASTHQSLVLFTTKSKVPPLFSVLAASPHFKGKVGFVLAQKKVQDVSSEFGVTEYPAIALVSRDLDGAYTQQVYTGKIEYTGIAKWLLAKALGVEDADPSAAPEEEEDTPKPSKKNSDETAPKKGPPKPATPVRPVELTPQDWATFCSSGPTSVKVRGRQPWCVVAFDNPSLDLEAVFTAFEHDSVLVFWVPEEKQAQWSTALASPSSPIGSSDVLVLRSVKDKVKSTVWKNDGAGTAGFENFMAKILGGEVTFDRHESFPALVEA